MERTQKQRHAIAATMSDGDPEPSVKITELPLPPQLIKYLTIPELDDIMEIFNNTEEIDSYMMKCLSIQELDDIIRRNKKNNPHNNHYVK